MAIQIPARPLETLSTTAGARVANAVAQKFGTKGINAIQRINTASDFVAGILGLDNVEDQPQPLLGGITLKEARETYSQLQSAQLARKSLWFIELEDITPPDLHYVEGVGAAARPSNPLASALGALRSNPFTMMQDAARGKVASLFGAGGTGGRSTPQVSVPHLFNLFATSVSYSPVTLSGEKVKVGGATIDQLTGSEPVEMTVTTYDDGAGTIKRWFDAKAEQAVHRDGTFGLPDDYLVRIRVFHATPKPDRRAYSAQYLMRPVSLQHELSRSDRTVEELQLVFTQFDSFAT